jgi:hypothetical protein
LLKLSPESISERFFAGLSPENLAEAERMDPEMPLEKEVSILEKIEKRRATTRLGIANREYKKESVPPVQLPSPIQQQQWQQPPISQQEPVTIRPVSEGLSKEHITQLLNTQAENLTKAFQAQFQSLQDSIKKPPIQQQQQSLDPNSIEGMQARANQAIDEYNRRLDSQGGWITKDTTESKVHKIAERIARKMAEREREREDRELAKMIGGLSINDPDEMDTSNLIRRLNDNVSFDVVEGNDGELHIQLVRKKK